MFLNYKLLIDFTEYMIIYPIKWYNFLNRVINKSSIYYNVIIIPKKTLIKYEKTFDDIFKILSDNKVITKQIENQDFVIVYMQNSKITRIFKKWLNLIILRACLDLFQQVKATNIFEDDFYILIDNISIGVSEINKYDINIGLKGKSTIVYSYNYFTFIQSLEKCYYLQRHNKNV